MLIVDTGPVVAAANRKDTNHRACVELLENATGPLILPAPILSEIGYMLASRVGAQAEADFLRDVADGVYTLASVDTADAGRAAHLVEQYADLPLGTADACVVSVAERRRVTKIATLDRRHFGVVRPSHAPAFTLLP